MAKVRAEWTADQVMEEEERWRQKKPDTVGIPTSPAAQWNALHQIEAAEKRFMDGDRTAAMHAVYLCSCCDLAIPAWAAKAFIGGYQKILNCRVATWDDAFGSPFPKNFRLHDARLRRENTPRILVAVMNAVLDEGIPIDAGLFEEVGQRLGLGARQVRETWYSGAGSGFRTQVKTVKERWAEATRRSSKATSR